MAINIPLDFSLPVATQFNANNPANLHVNQIVDAIVIDIQSEKNTVNLQVSDFTVQVQLQQNLIQIQPGQALQLQVMKLLPTPEFTLISTNNMPITDKQNVVLDQAVPVLKVVSPFLAIIRANFSEKAVVEHSVTTASGFSESLQVTNFLKQPEFKLNQLLPAKVIDVQLASNRISVQVNGQKLELNTIQPLILQAGQSVQLKVIKLQPEPLFSINATVAKLITPRIVEYPVIIKLLNSASADKGANLLLQPEQILTAKLITVPNQSNVFSLHIAGDTWQVQAQESLPLQAGQSVMLQVLKLTPQPEFSLTAAPTSEYNVKHSELNAPKVLTNKPVTAEIKTESSALLKLLNTHEVLQATVVGTDQRSLTLQIQSQTSLIKAPGITGKVDAVPIIVTLDKKQIIFHEDTRSETSVDTPVTSSVLKHLVIGNQVNIQLAKSTKQPLFMVSLLEKLSITKPQMMALVKQLLPIQNSPVDVLSQILHMQAFWQNNLSIPQALKQCAQILLAIIPQYSQLQDEKQLRQNIIQSGVFLEAKLVEALLGKMPGNLTADLKYNLLKFSEAVSREIDRQNGTKALSLSIDDRSESAIIQNFSQLESVLEKATSGLAKITLDQLHSLPHDDNAKQVWQLELPFIYKGEVNSVKIEIEQEKASQNHNKHTHWQVNITLTPPELATIYCTVSSYDNVVNAAFWCKTADTVEKINFHLDYLKQQLEQKGIKTGFMAARQGKPDEKAGLTQSLDNLLNEKA